MRIASYRRLFTWNNPLSYDDLSVAPFSAVIKTHLAPRLLLYNFEHWVYNIRVSSGNLVG